jgi:hypothetical protein
VQLLVYPVGKLKIRSKLLLPEFLDLIKSNDICIFLETETDIYDIFNLPTGYTSSCTSKCRSKFCKKSGGIIFIYKTELDFFFKFPKNDSEYASKKNSSGEQKYLL